MRENSNTPIRTSAAGAGSADLFVVGIEVRYWDAITSLSILQKFSKTHLKIF
jgi:hypothetical protein